MEKITTQSLNALFDCFNEQPNSVLWMHSQDYQRQIYLSQTFESIWGVQAEKLYNSPANWSKYLYTEDIKRVDQHVQQRLANPEKLDKDLLFYRIVNEQNNIKFLKSSAFLLTDGNNIDLAYFGITQTLSEMEWQEEIRKQNFALSSDPQSEMKKYLFNILRNELHLNVKLSASQRTTSESSTEEKIILMDSKRPIVLTQRESDCIYHLIHGKSAKQTANIMNISARTVEFHLGNIKEKANCRTKLELLSKVVKVKEDI